MYIYKIGCTISVPHIGMLEKSVVLGKSVLETNVPDIVVPTVLAASPPGSGSLAHASVVDLIALFIDINRWRGCNHLSWKRVAVVQIQDGCKPGWCKSG